MVRTHRDRHDSDDPNKGIIAPHGAAYPDPEHPLFEGFYSNERGTAPEELMRRIDMDLAREDSAHDGQPSEQAATPTVRRLRDAYERAKKHDGITLEKWARYATNGESKTQRAAGDWLKSPSTMTRDEVMRTCELFGCSLAYLQGRESDVRDVMVDYLCLDTKRRVAVSAMLRELLTLQTFLDNQRLSVGGRKAGEVRERYQHARDAADTIKDALA